jgi:hypothetical protein
MQAGLLPFGTGYHSNHLAIFVVINIDNILNTKIGAIQSITAWKLIQASQKERKIFIKEVDKHYNNQNIYNFRSTRIGMGHKPHRGIRMVQPRNGNQNVTRRETD